MVPNDHMLGRPFRIEHDLARGSSPAMDLAEVLEYAPDREERHRLGLGIVSGYLYRLAHGFHPSVRRKVSCIQ